MSLFSEANLSGTTVFGPSGGRTAIIAGEFLVGATGAVSSVSTIGGVTVTVTRSDVGSYVISVPGCSIFNVFVKAIKGKNDDPGSAIPVGAWKYDEKWTTDDEGNDTNDMVVAFFKYAVSGSAVTETAQELSAKNVVEFLIVCGETL